MAKKNYSITMIFNHNPLTHVEDIILYVTQLRLVEFYTDGINCSEFSWTKISFNNTN